VTTAAVGRLRAKWRAGEPAFGAWCTLGSDLGAELLARAGFDYVCLDAQHGMWSVESTSAAAQAVRAAGSVPLVRVPAGELWLIGRALDLGASGVIVPLVSSAEEAAAAAASCRYPPVGGRSFGPIRSGLDPTLTLAERHEQVLCIAMIETAGGVESLEAICAVPGVDAVYVGPRDLGLTHGLEAGPEYDALVASIAARARLAGKPAGFHCYNGAAARAALDTGFTFVTAAMDGELLPRTAAAELTEARGGHVPNAP
jgi:4-hydroxy-2-oxoheptanedioate aldolase